MKLLQELHNLHEADLPGENKIEIADLIKHFPNNYKKAIERLWGGPRLAYHGIPFHDELMEQSADAVKEWSKRGGELHLDLSNIPFTDEEGSESDIEVSYDEQIDPEKDGQEVYVGYNSDKDAVYFGYDFSRNEEVFNEEWDKAFKDATGEDFELKNKLHYKAFVAAHKEFNKEQNCWALFEMEFEDDKLVVKDVQTGPGLFYQREGEGGHDVAKNDGLIDLRLD